MTFKVVNPTTGEVADAFETMDATEVQGRINAADNAFKQWQQMDMTQRAAPMREAARTLESEKEGHASLMALEMGKPIGEGRAEIEKCAWLCRHYADNAAEMLRSEKIPADFCWGEKFPGAGDFFIRRPS